MIAAVVLNSTPLNDVWAMHQTGTPAMVAPLPWAAMGFNCSLWCLYGLLLRQWVPLVTCNIVGIVAAGAALYTHIQFLPQKAAAGPRYLAGGTLAAAILLFVACYDPLFQSLWYHKAPPVKVMDAIGSLGVVVNVLMYSSPLASVKNVLASRSTAKLSLPLALAAFICAVLWTAQGIAMSDPYIWAPNTLGCVFSSFQLSLFHFFGDDRKPMTRHQALL